MSTQAWGEQSTQFFYDLTPDKILNAIEKELGVRCTGRSFALNSMENRVYEIEIELNHDPKTPGERFLIAKFYRPGRWTKEQIEEEHEFLAELDENEIPVIAPYVNEAGESVFTIEDSPIYFAIFPKQGGRSPDELTDQQMTQVGRLLARLHQVGSQRKAQHRVRIDPTTYGLNSLDYLLNANVIPNELLASYEGAVRQVCQLADPLFKQVQYQRIHGDCHMGNLLFGSASFYWVDFDDMLMGPCIQDLWLLIPGRGDEGRIKLEALLKGYELMKSFNYQELKLIEPLRALRYVHFSAWIAKRWQDPAFPKAFPYYGTVKYWQDQMLDLREQVSFIEESL